MKSEEIVQLFEKFENAASELEGVECPPEIRPRRQILREWRRTRSCKKYTLPP